MTSFNFTHLLFRLRWQENAQNSAIIRSPTKENSKIKKESKKWQIREYLPPRRSWKINLNGGKNTANKIEEPPNVRSYYSGFSDMETAHTQTIKHFKVSLTHEISPNSYQSTKTVYSTFHEDQGKSTLRVVWGLIAHSPRWKFPRTSPSSQPWTPVKCSQMLRDQLRASGFGKQRFCSFPFTWKKAMAKVPL